MSVHLPLPLGPSRPSFVPGERTRFTSLKSVRPPSDLVTLLGGEQLARLPAGGGEVDVRAAPSGALRVLQVGQLVHHLAGLLDAALGLGRAGLGPAAEPLDLPPHLLASACCAGLLGGEELLPLLEEVAVRAVDAEVPLGVGAVQLDRRGWSTFSRKYAVVADEHERERRVRQQLFEPEDAFEVEVVRRLVEQQQVRLADQLAGDRQPLSPAAGQRVDRLVGVAEPDLAEQDVAPRSPARARRRGSSAWRVDERPARTVAPAREHVLLRQVARAAVAGGDSIDPSSGCLDAGQDLQQRRLARAVRPDQARPLGVVEADAQAVEDHAGAEGFLERIASKQDRHLQRVFYRVAQGKETVSRAQLMGCDRSGLPNLPGAFNSGVWRRLSSNTSVTARSVPSPPTPSPPRRCRRPNACPGLSPAAAPVCIGSPSGRCRFEGPL